MSTSRVAERFDRSVILARVRESKGSALRNAASVANLLLTAEVMVAEAPKAEHDHPSPGGGMSGTDM